MKYFLLIMIVIVVIILLICYFLRRRWAIRKVKMMSDMEKLCRVDAALNPFGFMFDLNCDIVTSRNDAWQRDVGYADIYDLKAPFVNMVMDAEPIFFKYDEKQYRIEFWKGQYGITTGAEIGIYICDCHEKCKNFYRAANDEEMLDMSFVLTKKCDLFSRNDKSWWLTGFDVGVFSKPSDLKMSICICFPSCEMRDAFVDALIESGYSNCQLNICENTVCFEYCCPKHYCKHRILKYFVQLFNWIYCHIFQCFTRYFNRTIDKLTYLSYMLPCFYRFVIRLSIPRRKHRKHRKHHKREEK